MTEAFTWLTTGIAAGLAGGSALAGVLAEGPGAGAAFLVAAVGAAAAALFAGARRRTIMPRGAGEPVPARVAAPPDPSPYCSPLTR